jgi:hypothetical protein
MFNPELHTHLVELGFTYTYYPPEFDDGDPENGPGTWGCPAFDEYEDATTRVIIDQEGHVEVTLRDLELEAWLDDIMGE